MAGRSVGWRHRFAAEALALRRTDFIQKLAPLAASNPTAMDTVLGRLLLSAVDRALDLPKVLSELNMAQFGVQATASERVIA